MSLRLYLHTRNERAETSALLDSGATENFIHLDYARRRRLVVKQLHTPRKIVNVDGTPNTKGEIKYYVDLDHLMLHMYCNITWAPSQKCITTKVG